MKAFTKAFGILFTTVLIAVIVGVAGVLVATKLPIPGALEIKIVKSGSMEPAIPTGSIVVVQPKGEYALGDIITFGKDTKTDVPTTHRIVDISTTQGSPMYTTKGDANEEADPNPVARREVIGAVIFHLPYAGYLLDFARQPIGFTLLIGIPAGLIILEELVTIAHETMKWRRGRRDGGSGEGGGRSNTEGSPRGESLGTHLRLMYVKRFKMDEVHVRRAFTLPLPKASRVAAFLHADSYGTSTALVVGLICASTLFGTAQGSTFAYFQDIERSMGNVFAAGTWDDAPPGVVLNEFLPNPDGDVFGDDASPMPQGEWVELYNNGAGDVDLAGWKIRDEGGNEVLVQVGVTVQGSSVILGHGWLVVYLNGAILDNDADTLELVNAENAVADSYAYNVCPHDPTPGGGNSSEGDCEETIAANKSYARLPTDGLSDFVDPIPTPGQPNIYGGNALIVADLLEEAAEEAATSTEPGNPFFGEYAPVVDEGAAPLDGDEAPAGEAVQEEGILEPAEGGIEQAPAPSPETEPAAAPEMPEEPEPAAVEVATLGDHA